MIEVIFIQAILMAEQWSVDQESKALAKPGSLDA